MQEEKVQLKRSAEEMIRTVGGALNKVVMDQGVEIQKEKMMLQYWQTEQGDSV